MRSTSTASAAHEPERQGVQLTVPAPQQAVAGEAASIEYADLLTGPADYPEVRLVLYQIT